MVAGWLVCVSRADAFPELSRQNQAPIGIIYFESAAAFRDWFDAHHASEQAVWVGFYKKATGTPSVTHAQAVDEALCYG